MKHLTLIPGDNQVYVDGECMVVDLSDMDKTIHAVQWSETFGQGEIEFVNNPFQTEGFKPNERIKSRKPYQKYVAAWNVAKKASDAEKARLAEEMRMQRETNAPTSQS